MIERGYVVGGGDTSITWERTRERRRGTSRIDLLVSGGPPGGLTKERTIYYPTMARSRRCSREKETVTRNTIDFDLHQLQLIRADKEKSWKQ